MGPAHLDCRVDAPRRVTEVLGMIPAEQLADLGPIGQRIGLIGTGEIITALLPAIPRTASLGILLDQGRNEEVQESNDDEEDAHPSHSAGEIAEDIILRWAEFVLP
jgi:hypothetical protein